jgi:hypothetical protein
MSDDRSIEELLNRIQIKPLEGAPPAWPEENLSPPLPPTPPKPPDVSSSALIGGLLLAALALLFIPVIGYLTFLMMEEDAPPPGEIVDTTPTIAEVIPAPPREEPLVAAIRDACATPQAAGCLERVGTTLSTTTPLAATTQELLGADHISSSEDFKTATGLRAREPASLMAAEHMLLSQLKSYCLKSERITDMNADRPEVLASCTATIPNPEALDFQYRPISGVRIFSPPSENNYDGKPQTIDLPSRG